MVGAGAVEQHARGRPCPRRGAMHTHGQRPSSALRPSAPSRSCTAAAPLCTPTRALGGASGTEQHDTRRQRARRGSAAAAGQGHGARQGARGGRAHLVLLVHLPHLVVLDGKEDEALRVGGEQRLELVGRDGIRGQLHGACGPGGQTSCGTARRAHACLPNLRSLTEGPRFLPCSLGDGLVLISR